MHQQDFSTQQSHIKANYMPYLTGNVTFSILKFFPTTTKDFWLPSHQLFCLPKVFFKNSSFFFWNHSFSKDQVSTHKGLYRNANWLRLRNRELLVTSFQKYLHFTAMKQRLRIITVIPWQYRTTLIELQNLVNSKREILLSRLKAKSKSSKI